MDPENPDTNPTELYELEDIPPQKDNHLTAEGGTILVHPDEK
jgi:hypothetical protein